MTRLGFALIVLATTLIAACPASGAERIVKFQSPSGNINCVLASGFADCLVRRHTWRNAPRRPASCDLDWVAAEISLSGARVRVGACRGDVGPLCGPQRGLRCTTLAYGRSVTVGAIRCASAANGVTCRRRDGRRVGFRIAREGYAIFR
jgi:hypothetical protein